MPDVNNTELNWLAADWPAPRGVVAGCTTRQGGVSRGAYAALNLADHVGDDPVAVQRNRQLLQARLELARPPSWLTQVHGAEVCVLGDTQPPAGVEADAAFSRCRGIICAVMTADCLPVLLTSRAGSEVAAVHAGWRGLAKGVIESALRQFSAEPTDVLAWLGPAIGPRAYEVGEDVFDAFVREDAGAAAAFGETRPGHWHLDMYALARRRLNRVGVQAIYGGGLCTYTDADRFYSYRRDGATGRMASLICMV